MGPCGPAPGSGARDLVFSSSFVQLQPYYSLCSSVMSSVLLPLHLFRVFFFPLCSGLNHSSSRKLGGSPSQLLWPDIILLILLEFQRHFLLPPYQKMNTSFSTLLSLFLSFPHFPSSFSFFFLFLPFSFMHSFIWIYTQLFTLINDTTDLRRDLFICNKDKSYISMSEAMENTLAKCRCNTTDIYKGWWLQNISVVLDPVSVS